MASEHAVAFLAGIVNAATLHLNGDHVESSPVVSASGLCIQIDSSNFGAGKLHRETRKLTLEPRFILHGSETPVRD
jgi:hypothetical protein